MGDLRNRPRYGKALIFTSYDLNVLRRPITAAPGQVACLARDRARFASIWTR